MSWTVPASPEGGETKTDTEVAEENDEEGREGECVLLDLDGVFHGAPVPKFCVHPFCELHPWDLTV